MVSKTILLYRIPNSVSHHIRSSKRLRISSQLMPPNTSEDPKSHQIVHELLDMKFVTMQNAFAAIFPAAPCFTTFFTISGEGRILEVIGAVFPPGMPDVKRFVLDQREASSFAKEYVSMIKDWKRRTKRIKHLEVMPKKKPKDGRRKELEQLRRVTERLAPTCCAEREIWGCLMRRGGRGSCTNRILC
jgi:hypothetical protein